VDRSGWRRVSWLLCAAAGALVVAAIVFIALRWHLRVPAGATPAGVALVQVLGFAGFPVLALLLTARRADPLYVVLWGAAALGWGAVAFAGSYVACGLALGDGWPAVGPIGTLGDVGWCIAVASMPLLLLLFPDGALPSPRWRALPPILSTGCAGACVAVVLIPGPSSTAPVDRWTVMGGRLGRIGEPLLFVSALVLLLAVLAAIVSIVTRYRAGSALMRLQIRWVAFAALLLGVPFVVLGLANVTAAGVWGALLLAVPMLATCAAVGVAVLRHRLYDIDVIIHRTMVYGLLTAAVVAGYIAVVGSLSALLSGRARWPVALAAAGIVAVAFQPARERLQRAVNRLMYGDRDEPHEVVSRLADRLAATPEPAAILPTVVDTAAQALRLPHVSIWQIDGDVLRLAAGHNRPTGATSPPTRAVDGLSLSSGTEVTDAVAGDLLRAAIRPLESPLLPTSGAFGAALETVGVTLVFPLRHAGELVGVLCAAPRRAGDGWSDPDRRALTQLARHTGAVVHADRLTTDLRRSLEELTRSRKRLVTTQEQERRRIQRDLHDGLGPTLAAIRLHLETCLDPGTTAPTWLRRELERIDELVGQAGSDVRRLVYGLHPPTLDQLGLVAALDQHVTQFGRDTCVATRFTGVAVPNTSAAVEITIFRVTQEALTNVAKHAGAASVDVTLWHDDARLHLRVDDDGTGLRPGPVDGTGLRGMHDRAASVGGVLALDGRPGGGTRLTLTVPKTPET
jgi:signal transduction histidine kinase